jgi:nitrite reductase/ring-hydroxylating ferredoxin subunit
MAEDIVTLSEACVPSAGALRAVEAGREKILLTHFVGELHAIGAICPHAGAPLDQGVLHHGRIVCPWHKAEFCARTGKLLSPPAVDDLPSYTIERAPGELRLRKQARRQPSARCEADTRCFVVVGGGAAGAMAVQTLREEGFGGRIVLIDRTGRVPYDRTLLSKYFLSGGSGGEKTPLQEQAYYPRHGIERVAAEVTA